MILILGPRLQNNVFSVHHSFPTTFLTERGKVLPPIQGSTKYKTFQNKSVSNNVIGFALVGSQKRFLKKVI